VGVEVAHRWRTVCCDPIQEVKRVHNLLRDGTMSSLPTLEELFASIDLPADVDMHEWCSLSRLELLRTLEEYGLPLPQRQGIANAWFKASRAGQLTDSTIKRLAAKYGDVPTVDEWTRERNGVMVRLGACSPNAPIPTTSLPDDAVNSSVSLGAAELPSPGRIFCISDLHTDYKANLDWCRSLCSKKAEYERDAVIVAGDVSCSHVLLEETLALLAGAFGHVFFTPGNHELWVRGVGLSGGLHVRTETIDSLQRLREVCELCARLGVHTAPAYAAGAIVAPLFGWYHSSFDTEPDVEGWEGIPPHDVVLSDFHRCSWPSELDVSRDDRAIARHLDSLNDQHPGGRRTLESAVEALRAQYPGAPLITCSHFVPRIELAPEKRYLFFPPLSKGIGSTFLASRIAALRPSVHVFGHTHLGWDATLDGVRYLQAPLAYPQERTERLGTVAISDSFPHGQRAAPLLVYDACARTYPPRYDAGWSNFYARYPRRPELCRLLAPRAAQRYTRVDGVGGVGYFAEGDHVSEVTPAWKLGAVGAVSIDVNRMESAM
jgi:hypothetical protein